MSRVCGIANMPTTNRVIDNTTISAASMLRQLLQLRIIFTLVVSSALLHGCATTSVTVESATKQRLTAAPELPVEAWFLEARDIVSRQLGADLSAVTLQVADTAGIAVHAKSSLMDALEHDLENARFAEDLVNNILTLQTESVLAIYAPAVKQILLHDSNLNKYIQSQSATPKQALQALLIHELVHAVDDIKHDVFRQHSLSYQEVFAKSAVIEGHAQWQTRNICRSLGCDDAFAQLNRYMFDSGPQEDPALQYVQNRSFKNLEFVYKEGERFIDQLKRRQDGEAMLSLAFKSPPRDSIQIIDPDSFPNRDRERRNDKLSVLIEKAVKPWNKHSTGSLKRNVLAAAAFSVDPAARQPVVNFYTSKIVAATKHEYYEHASDTPIPVAVIALQTDSDATATKTASLIFDSTLNTYKQLRGDLVEFNDWNRNQASAKVRISKTDYSIDMQTASSFIKNGLVDAAYPVEVVTATSGPYLVHIDGRYVHGQEDLMQFAGRLLLAMQNAESKSDAKPTVSWSIQ